MMMWWSGADAADADVLKLCDMTEDEQMQWAMEESVKSSTNGTVPLTFDSL